MGVGGEGTEREAAVTGAVTGQQARTTLLPFLQNTSGGPGGLDAHCFARMHRQDEAGKHFEKQRHSPSRGPRLKATTDVFDILHKLKIFWKFYSESVLTRVGFICVAGDHAKKNALLQRAQIFQAVRIRYWQPVQNFQ